MRLLRSPADEVQSRRKECKDTIRELDTRNAKVEELKLMPGLQVDEAGKIGEMQRRLDVQEKQLASRKLALEAKEADVKEKDHYCERLELELKLARAAISRGEGFTRNFVDRVCTGHSSLLRTQAPSYLDRLNAFLTDAQARG